MNTTNHERISKMRNNFHRAMPAARAALAEFCATDEGHPWKGTEITDGVMAVQPDGTFTREHVRIARDEAIGDGEFLVPTSGARFRPARDGETTYNAGG
ncbi:MAG: hypothetical protein U0520_04245 [Candidatus Saccharimonadales bacterium]